MGIANENMFPSSCLDRLARCNQTQRHHSANTKAAAALYQLEEKVFHSDAFSRV